MPQMLLRCLLFLCCVAASSSSGYERAARGVRGSRRAYAIDEFRLFDQSTGPTNEDDFQTQGMSVNIEIDSSAKDAQARTGEHVTSIDFPLIQGQHYVGDSEAGGISGAAFDADGSSSQFQTGPPSADHGSSGSWGSFSKGKSKATLPPKGSKVPKGLKGSKASKKSNQLPVPKRDSESKAPHVAKKKLPLPKQASQKYMSKIGGSASRPTLSPAPSLHPPHIPPSKNSSKDTIPPSKLFPKGTIPPSKKSSKGTMAPSKKSSKGTISPSKKSSKGAEVPLAPFTIAYSLDLTRIPMDVEIDQVVGHTGTYLNEYFRRAYPSLERVTTVLDGEMLVSPTDPFIMNYTSVSIFSDGAHLPTQTTLNLELLQAFSAESKDAYIEILQHRLSPMNLFSTTYDILVQLEPSTGTNNGIPPGFDTGDMNATRNDGPSLGEENDIDNKTKIMVVSAAVAGTISIAICAVAVYMKRSHSDSMDEEKRTYSICDGTIAETAISASNPESISEQHVAVNVSQEDASNIIDCITSSPQAIISQDHAIQSSSSCCSELTGQEDPDVAPLPNLPRPNLPVRRKLHMSGPTEGGFFPSSAVTKTTSSCDADCESISPSVENATSDEPKRVSDLIKMYSKS